MGTFNWDWESGPPDEAYERHSRDLAVVTREFAEWLDALPDDLLRRYSGSVRPARQPDLARFDRTAPIGGWVFEPSAPAASPLVVLRREFEGGVCADLGIGRAAVEVLPMCFCDACDEDSSSMIQDAREFVAVATGGFREFRRPYIADPGEILHEGPWLEAGHESEIQSASGASSNVKGELFDVTWAPWAPR